MGLEQRDRVRLLHSRGNWRQEDHLSATDASFSIHDEALPDGSRMTREGHVRLCVQERLACSVGRKPTGVIVRSPVVRIAGWRVTKTLKPIDKVSLGEITSHRAVTKVNAKCGLESEWIRGPSPQP